MNIYTIQFTQVLGVAIIIVFMFGTINLITKNKLVKFCARSLVCYFFIINEVSGGAYAQGIPHRLIFTTIIISLSIKYILNGSKPKIKSIVDILCGLSIIWNLETGIVMTMVWAATKGIVNSRNKKSIVLFLNVSKYVGGGILTFLIAWLTVSITNFVIYKGEWISFEEFIYPIGTDFVGAIGSDVDFSNILWIIVLGIVIFSFAFSLRKIILNKADLYEEAMCIISLSSIMLFPYFYNRAAFFNLLLVSYFQLVLIGLIVVKKLESNSRYLSIFGMIIFYFTILLYINSFFTYSNSYINIIENSGAKQYEELKKELSEVIPMDAVFYGYGSSFYSLFINNTKALPYNSVNFTSEGLIKTKKFFDEAKSDIVIIGNDDFVQGMMAYWVGVTLEDINTNYQVEDYTFSIKGTLLDFKVLKSKRNS